MYRACVLTLSGLAIAGMLIFFILTASKNPKALLRIHGDPLDPIP